MTDLFTGTDFMTTIIIEGKEFHIKHTTLSKEELVVLQLIINNDKITQRQIAKHDRFLGCHKQHEEQITHPNHIKESTLRKVRQIIRDLRLIHGAPILSDTSGYWIPTKLQEVNDTLSRIEQTARSQAKAHMVTFYGLRRVFQIEGPEIDFSDCVSIGKREDGCKSWGSEATSDQGKKSFGNRG